MNEESIFQFIIFFQMEHYFNEDLLYGFVYRYYPFDNLTQILVQTGLIVVGKILQALIQEKKILRNLKPYSIRSIANLVIGSFSYRVEGISDYLGAFGNFYLLNQPNIEKSENIKSEQNLDHHIEKILESNQIKDILDPLADRLQEIASFEEKNQELPCLDQSELKIKKVEFLKLMIGFTKSPEEQKKKKGHNKKSGKITDFLRANENLFQQKACWEIQEEKRTEVDEFQRQIQSSDSHEPVQQSAIKRKFYNGTSSNNMKITIQINNQKSLKKNEIDQNNNELILHYNELIPAQSLQTKMSNNKTSGRRKRKSRS